MKSLNRRLLQSLKDDKVILIEDNGREIYKLIESKRNIKNVAVLYFISQLFNCSVVSKELMQFIERCFPMFVDCTSFLDLDFKIILKIFSSSELHIDSEMQVFNAVVSWLGYKKERKVYAKDLILKIRLSLLSDPALKLIIENIAFFIDDYTFINDVVKDKVKGSQFNKTKTISRYCTNNNFHIVFCGGKVSGTLVRDVYSVKAYDLKTVEKLSNLKEGRQLHEVVCIKDEIFVFGGKDINLNCITSIEKYSNFTKTWEIVGHMPDVRFNFCACSFMGNAYVLGGFIQVEILNSILKFNPADCSWKEVAEMNESRCYASCTVFEGKIVVSGGYNDRSLNTVEVYDHVANSWTNMPNMIKGRSSHISASFKNKLFLVEGGNVTCEVYDSTCKKFVSIKSPDSRSLYFDLTFPVAVILIGNKFYVYNGGKTTCYIYNIENNTWSEELCEFSRNLSCFSCVKVPQC